jgi:uncharacterized membrane protein
MTRVLRGGKKGRCFLLVIKSIGSIIVVIIQHFFYAPNVFSKKKNEIQKKKTPPPPRWASLSLVIFFLEPIVPLLPVIHTSSGCMAIVIFDIKMDHHLVETPNRDC